MQAGNQAMTLSERADALEDAIGAELARGAVTCAIVATTGTTTTTAMDPIDEIAKITPQPITHVVIGSDHGDHTAGNAAFAPDVTFYIHPTSKDAL